MSNQNKQKDVRRWIIQREEKEEKLLVAVGRKRSGCIPVVIKALDWVNKHLTWSVKDDGTFNFHMTKEGNISEHTRLVKGRIDLERLKKTAQEIQQKSIKPINPKNRLLRDFIVLLPRNLEAWNEFYWRLYEYKGRKLIYPDSAKLKKMEHIIDDYFDILYVDELPESSSFLFGIYSDPEGRKFGVLLFYENNYYMIPISEMIEALVGSFIVESIWCPDCGLKSHYLPEKPHRIVTEPLSLRNQSVIDNALALLNPKPAGQYLTRTHRPRLLHPSPSPQALHT